MLDKVSTIMMEAQEISLKDKRCESGENMFVPVVCKHKDKFSEVTFGNTCQLSVWRGTVCRNLVWRRQFTNVDYGTVSLELNSGPRKSNGSEQLKFGGL